jgi:hypothetical protein
VDSQFDKSRQNSSQTSEGAAILSRAE